MSEKLGVDVELNKYLSVIFGSEVPVQPIDSHFFAFSEESVYLAHINLI